MPAHLPLEYLQYNTTYSQITYFGFKLQGPLYSQTRIVIKHDSVSSMTVRELKVTAVHPLTGRHLPVYVDNDLDLEWNQDCRLGLPDVCDTDQEFVNQRGVAYTSVLDPHTQTLVNSQQVGL